VKPCRLKTAPRLCHDMEFHNLRGTDTTLFTYQRRIAMEVGAINGNAHYLVN